MAANKPIYDYLDYRKYLEDFLKNSPQGSYGGKSRLAAVLGCNSAYISQVFNRGANFSLEQAEELNRYLHHSKEESRHFLLLIQYARAGSHHLKERIKDQIDEVLERRLNLKERTGIKTSISEADQAKFYSQWYYAATHMLVMLPQFQTAQAISAELKLSLEKTKNVLEFLLQIGLIQENAGRFSTGVNKLFLGKDSPMISKHHSNWRMKAIESLERDEDTDSKDLHYSTLFTYNKKDGQKIRETLAKTIDDVRALIKESEQENEISCMCLDFFKL